MTLPSFLTHKCHYVNRGDSEVNHDLQCPLGREKKKKKVQPHGMKVANTWPRPPLAVGPLLIYNLESRLASDPVTTKRKMRLNRRGI